MPTKSRKETSSLETVEGEANGESYELPPAERTENYDSDITLSHDVDGFWFWHVGGEKSDVGYFHPALAHQFAPSPAK